MIGDRFISGKYKYSSLYIMFEHLDLTFSFD